jgi:pyrroloquinoline-quinone synthase
MMDVFARLDDERRAVNVLEHPFYLRWSAGELSAEELAFYAGEYRHAVLALAEASGRAAEKASGAAYEPGLRRHAEEEVAHVELWDDFARSVGTGRVAMERSEPELAETGACVRAWTAGGDLLEHLTVLYAIEASQPAISETKLEGMRAHYGHREGSPGGEYFELHATRDVEHAQQARELIEELMKDGEVGQADAERMVARARQALEGNWALLDGVERQFAQVP